MKQWQSFSALKRVKEELEALAADAANALEQVISTPADEEKNLECIQEPLARFTSVPDTLRLLEFRNLALLTREIVYLLTDTLTPASENAVDKIDARLQLCFVSLVRFPGLLDDALENSGDDFRNIFPFLNRLRNTNNGALIFNKQVLHEKSLVMFRQQFDLEPGKLKALLEKQADFYIKSCAVLQQDPDNQKALQILDKVVANLALMLRDYRIGTLWGMAAGLLETLIDSVPEENTDSQEKDASAAANAAMEAKRAKEARVQAIKILAWLGNTLKEASDGGVEALDKDIDDSTREALLTQFKAIENPGPISAMVLQWYELNGDAGLEEEARRRSLQANHFGRSAYQTTLSHFIESISRLLDNINHLTEKPEIPAESITEIQTEVTRLAQVMVFLGLDELSKTLAGIELTSESNADSTRELAKTLFSIHWQLSGELANAELALFSPLPGREKTQVIDSARLHSIQASIDSLEVVINGLDDCLEEGEQALQPAIDNLDILSRVFSMMTLDVQAGQMELARNYLTISSGKLLSGQAPEGYQSLCHLVINQLWSLEQMALGREDNSAIYLNRSAEYAQRLQEQLGIAEKAQEEAIAAEELEKASIEEASVEITADEATEPEIVDEVVENDVIENEELDAPASQGFVEEEFDTQEAENSEEAQEEQTSELSKEAIDVVADASLIPTLTSEQESDEKPDEATDVDVSVPAEQSELEDEDEDDDDAELKEIFVEEFDEIFSMLSNDLVSLKQNSVQDNLIADNRRYFHTLKGSGKMVGAEHIHPLSYAMEKLFDHYAEQKAITGAGLSLTQKVLNILPVLKANFLSPDTNPVDLKQVEQLCNEAENLLKVGGSLDVETVPVIEKIPDPESTLEQEITLDTDPETGNTPDSEPAPSISTSLSPEIAEEEDEVEDEEDQVDQTLLAIFLDEAEELLEGLDDLYLRWRESPSDKQSVDEYLRILHTLKGNSALVQDEAFRKAAHEYETFIIDTRNKNNDFNDEFFDTCDMNLAGLHEYCRRYVKDENGFITRDKDSDADADTKSDFDVSSSEPAVEPESSIEEVNAAISADNYNSAAEPTIEEHQEGAAQPEVIEENQSVESAANTDPVLPELEPEPQPAPIQSTPDKPGPSVQAREPDVRAVAEEQVKVSSQLLRYLLNDADEINFSRNRIEKSFHDISGLLVDMDETLVRLKSYVKRFNESARHNYLQGKEAEEHDGESRISDEFDALEMDRYTELHEMALSLGEDYADLQDIRSNLNGRLKDIDNVLTGQQRLTNSLQDGLITSQMLPFSSIVPRLRRLVRQISRELNKNVRFEVENQQGNLDKNMLQSIITPFEHIIRNAIDHGIELPEDRIKAGKDEQAVIAVRVTREGASILVEIKDDGKGVDVEKVKQKAIAKGILDADGEISPDEACQLILAAGFSTAQSVSQISGRGVGLDVVRNEIAQVGGTIEISTEQGQGTTFVLHLPLTSSLNRSLLFEVQETPYVVLMNSLDGVLVEKLSTLMKRQSESEETPVFEYGDKNYEYIYLGTLLNSDTQLLVDNQDKSIYMLLVSGKGRNFALHVDDILESRDLVVKTFDKQLAAIPGIGGGVIMTDGNVAVVLDLKGMVNHYADADVPSLDVATLQPMMNENSNVRKTVMVVDDSITVRKVTTKILKRNGFDVITAKDGIEAITLLEQHVPDVILLDIEMPRMDGFEVAMHIRKQESPIKDIPIIMITSRIGKKHQTRAKEIGVNKYLGKPFQEKNLLAQINSF